MTRRLDRDHAPLDRGRRGMPLIGRIIYWSFTVVALLLAGNAALEFSAAETAKGNAMMRSVLYFIAAVALWSFGRAILRAFAGK